VAQILTVTKMFFSKPTEQGFAAHSAAYSIEAVEPSTVSEEASI